jgi:hypothetical protein
MLTKSYRHLYRGIMSSMRQLVRAVRPILFMIEDKDSGTVIGASVRGSAFVVDADAGLLGTAKHVVKGMAPASLRVRSVYTVNGEYALGLVNTVREIFEHPTKDFAVLRVSAHGTKRRTVSLEKTFTSNVGDQVALFGFASGTDFVWCDEILGPGSPKSLNPVVFHGHVAALVPDDGRVVEVVVYDATTFGGNSGGPVVSVETGEVVAVHLRSAANQVGFGLPIVQCAAFIDHVAAGKVVPNVGATPQPDPKDELLRYIDWEKKVAEASGEADVQTVLMDALEIDDSTDLLFFDWDDPSGSSSSSAVALIQVTAPKRPAATASIALEESIIPPDVPRKLEEVRLKVRGEIWDIHKNDADPFPSNPHAHNIQTGVCRMAISIGSVRSSINEFGRRTWRPFESSRPRKVSRCPHWPCSHPSTCTPISPPRGRLVTVR